MPKAVEQSQSRSNRSGTGVYSFDPYRSSVTVGGSGLHFPAQEAGPSPTGCVEAPVEREYANVRIKGQGLADELHSTNETILKTIKSMSADMHPTLEVCSYMLVGPSSPCA